MERSTTKWLPVLATLLALLPAVAQAQTPGDDHLWPDNDKPKPTFAYHIQSDSNGVDVEISARETIPGQSSAPAPNPAAGAPLTSNAAAAPAPGAGAPQPAADSGARSWSDDSGYHRVTSDGHTEDLEAPNIGLASQDSWSAAYQNHVGDQAYLLFVDNQFQGVVWIPDQPNVNRRLGTGPEPTPNTPGAGCGGCTDARQVALDIETHIPLPPIKLRVNPDMGLVGMAGWFWVDGYDGRTIQQSRTVTVPPPAPNLPPTSFTVTVKIWLDDYSWTFGDGSSITTQSLGRPYPQTSDIQHTYEQSSLAFDSGFPVYMTVRFRAEFSVNGGAPQALPPIQHTYEANHPVQEVQAILNHP